MSSRGQSRSDETTQIEQGNRVRNHQRNENNNRGQAIRDRARGAQMAREDEARNNDRANRRSGRLWHATTDEQKSSTSTPARTRPRATTTRETATMTSQPSRGEAARRFRTDGTEQGPRVQRALDVENARGTRGRDQRAATVRQRGAEAQRRGRQGG